MSVRVESLDRDSGTTTQTESHEEDKGCMDNPDKGRIHRGCDTVGYPELDITIKQEPFVNELVCDNFDGLDFPVPNLPGTQGLQIPGMMAADVRATEPVCFESRETATAENESDSSENTWQIFKDGESIGHIVNISEPKQFDRSTHVNPHFHSTTEQPEVIEPTTNKPFKCSVCGARCKSEGRLKIHSRKHTRDKSFKCSECEFACFGQFALTAHMRSHTGERPYKCLMCPFTCILKHHLTRHMRTHTAEKPFKCSVCEYSCTRRDNLNEHTMTHTEEKPFKCSMCPYRCAIRHYLHKHMRIHTGEKPFKCSICEFRCSRKSILITHMRTHTGEKPFKCTMCQYRCAAPTSLRRHLKTHNEHVSIA